VMTRSILDVIWNLGPSIVGLLANLWLFCQFLSPKPKTTGFLMVSILAIPNCIFNVLLILNLFTNFVFEYSYYPMLIFSLIFSNFWASCMTYLIYKSIRNPNFDLRSNLCKAFAIVFFISTFIGIVSTIEFSFFFTVGISSFLMIFSQAFTFICSAKSIKFIQHLLNYEPKSTRLYVQNTRLYSLAQLFAYTPFVIYLFVQDHFLIPIYLDKWISLITQGLVSLSGLIIVLIFIFIGPAGFERTSYHEDEKDPAIDYSSISEPLQP